MDNGTTYVNNTYSTKNTELLERAQELARYDFLGEVFVNFGDGKITFITENAERALSELTGVI